MARRNPLGSEHDQRSVFAMRGTAEGLAPSQHTGTRHTTRCANCDKPIQSFGVEARNTWYCCALCAHTHGLKRAANCA
jgi:formamidopyrimidine-DNA glycosylase